MLIVLDKGAFANDAETHVIEFAIRVPAWNSTRNIWVPNATHFPPTLILHESLSYQTPLRGIFSEKSPTKLLGTNFSIASVLSPSCAFITTSKFSTKNSSQTILRISIPCKSPWSTESVKLEISKKAVKDAVFYIGTALEACAENCHHHHHSVSGINMPEPDCPS